MRVAQLALVALIVVPAALLLEGCDGPDIRKTLAQCQLQPGAKGEYENLDPEFLSLCMQSHGYIVDRTLRGVGDAKCGELPFPLILAVCYRRDRWDAEILARLGL